MGLVLPRCSAEGPCTVPGLVLPQLPAASLCVSCAGCQVVTMVLCGCQVPPAKSPKQLGVSVGGRGVSVGQDDPPWGTDQSTAGSELGTRAQRWLQGGTKLSWVLVPGGFCTKGPGLGVPAPRQLPQAAASVPQ